MKLLFRILAPLVIVGAAVLIARHLIASKPEPRTFDMPPQITKVEATRLKPESYQVYLDTQGTIRPRTTTTLIPEVSGRIVEVSPNFRDGGFFEKEEVLLRLEKVDYETALVVAETGVAEAERALQEEKIRSDQALENWRRLGKGNTPSDLVLRKPQLAEAEARLRAAKAQVKKAERDLDRTDVKAPFAGRIIEQMVDVGQYVSQNTQLGRAFATDSMEVRLPLTNHQLSFVDLPAPGAESGPDVLITGQVGRESEQWQGRVVRVDSAIDEASRQLFVVAEIQDPYHLRTGEVSPLLKIGMFVDALVKGRELQNVFVLPRKAVRVGGEVIVIDAENKIERRRVDPLWSEDEKVVVAADSGGLKEGEVVCLTPLAYPANGAEVLPTIDGITPEIEQPPGGPGMGFGKKGMKGKKSQGGKGKENGGDAPGRS
ncbi:MAG: efflux RND transporter periplasmic adaptor subunit [Verrucomicrobiales bacterium]|nr:efflux RND transporter periplasmic adaptor subunit [Verrucomicrobiales bacterium]